MSQSRNLGVTQCHLTLGPLHQLKGAAGRRSPPTHRRAWHDVLSIFRSGFSRPQGSPDFGLRFVDALDRFERALPSHCAIVSTTAAVTAFLYRYAPRGKGGSVSAAYSADWTGYGGPAGFGRGFIWRCREGSLIKHPIAYGGV